MDFADTFLTNIDTVNDTQSTNLSIETQYEQERGKPMPSKNHSLLQMEIGFELKTQYGKQFDIFSELSLDLTSGGAVPDICIYAKTPRDWQSDVIKTKVLPLLAIEILSPKQAFNDIVDKIKDIYFPVGMKSAWIILPSIESVMLLMPNQKTATFNQGILKDEASGFELDIDKIFA
jgi:Uma2 family endonuclease